jgi:hypothetical protein
VDGAFRTIAPWQKVPLTARFKDVEDTVQDAAEMPGWMATGFFRLKGANKGSTWRQKSSEISWMIIASSMVGWTTLADFQLLTL